MFAKYNVLLCILDVTIRKTKGNSFVGHSFSHSYRQREATISKVFFAHHQFKTNKTKTKTKKKKKLCAVVIKNDLRGLRRAKTSNEVLAKNRRSLYPNR